MAKLDESILLRVMIILGIIGIIAAVSVPNFIAFKNRYLLKMPQNKAASVSPVSK